jgi:hypothetical protein
MAFVKESFMERADMAKFPICVACGTIPIYNPRLNIAICPLCDGPVKYMGDTIHNLEILPPLGRPKSKIVEVEMPYSTKLLSQEQETYLNLTMRYITTSGVECLKPLEFSGTSSEVVKELPRLILPETVAPAYIEEVPKAVLTVEQLRTMGSQLQLMTEQERAVADTVLEDSPEGIQLEQDAQMNAMAQLQNTPTKAAADKTLAPLAALYLAARQFAHNAHQLTTGPTFFALEGRPHWLTRLGCGFHATTGRSYRSAPGPIETYHRT